MCRSSAKSLTETFSKSSQTSYGLGPLFSSTTEQYFSTRGNSAPPPPTDICQCLETFLIVTTGHLGWGEWGREDAIGI